jgi:hypothetical protein
MCNTKYEELQIYDYTLYNILKHGVCIITSEVIIYVMIIQYAKP